MWPFGPKLEFELAEPGTDPTRRPNPHPSPGFLARFSGNAGLVLAVLAFLVLGYFKFVAPSKPKKEQAQAAATASPTVPPTATPEPGEQAGFFSNSNAQSGFLPTNPPPTATPTLTPTLAATPTLKPQIEEITYQVFTASGPVTCWCKPGTGEIGAFDGPADPCLDTLPSECAP
jgi:hypothetical protein